MRGHRHRLSLFFPVPSGSVCTIRVQIFFRGFIHTLHACDLYINDILIGSMTESSGYGIYPYTFSAAGTAAAYAICTDVDGNSTTGASTTIVISASSSGGSTASQEEDDAVTEVSQGNLIKLPCSNTTNVNDPCRAVYYYADDGKRHAFPNEKVFFTWFENFDDLVIVTSDLMSSISLGRNVTYHPGTKMVKFQTVRTVYCVGEEGELREVASEEIAASLYGETWNKQIDDISDAFFGNYIFGEEILDVDDYEADEVEEAVDRIDDIL